jgi:hypothetical protein
MFSPHVFNTVVEMPKIETPKIFIHPDAYEDMWHLVDIVGDEVGWLGSVYQRGNDYVIDEIFMPGQQVHSTTTELTPEGQEVLYNELSQRTDADEIINRIRFWGHSHVNMGVSPSGQDESQMKDFQQNGAEFFIRGIFNKKREAKFDVFLFAAKLVIRDVEWSIDLPLDAGRRAYWEKEIADKVKKITYAAPSNPYGHGYYAGRHSGYQHPYNNQTPAQGAYSGRTWDEDGYGYMDFRDDDFDTAADREFANEVMRSSRRETPEDEFFGHLARTNGFKYKTREERREAKRLRKLFRAEALARKQNAANEATEIIRHIDEVKAGRAPSLPAPQEVPATQPEVPAPILVDEQHIEFPNI